MIRCLLLLLMIGLSGCGPKQLEPDIAMECDNCARWNEPQKPFRIYGNTWFVGTNGLSSILIESDDGLVLIDGGLSQSAAIIEGNLRALGFDPLDIKMILLSHAHYDHAGGIAALQRFSGAAVYTSPEGAMALRSGTVQADDPQFLFGPEHNNFPAVKNVVAVEDNEVLKLADLEITAIFTPGHTPGGMSWSWPSCALSDCFQVVYADSMTAVSAEGYKFTAAGAGDQLRGSLDRIANLECDILLSPHPFFFDMEEKFARLSDGNPFVNNVACAIYAENMLDWLQQRLDSEGRSTLPSALPSTPPSALRDDQH